VKRTSISWLLLALIFGFYSIYVFSFTRDDSLRAIVSGVILAAASLVSLWKFLRDTRASKVGRIGHETAASERRESLSGTAGFIN
jgi:type VI protein secretion system component VasK